MNSKTAAVAAAAALLFVAGHAGAEDKTDTRADKVKCEGVNSCKGQGACHTASNGCAGKNSCKGKGFMMMSPEECDHAKGKMMKQDEKEG
jgi:uncharacterized membrane protein